MRRLTNISYTEIWFLAYISWLVVNECLFQQESISIKMLADLSVMCLAFGYVRLKSCHQHRILYVVIVYGILVACIGKIQMSLSIKTGAEWMQILFPSNPAVWGAWAGLSLLAVISSQKMWGKWYILWIILCLGLFTLLLYSRSRASWLGVMIGSVLLWNRQNIIHYVKTHRFVVLFGVLVVVVSWWGLYHYKQASVMGRLFIWKVCYDLIAEHPLVGQGQDAFRHHYLYTQADYFRQHPYAEEAIYADNVVYPYNELLKVLIESGLIGMVLFVGLFVSVMLRKKPDFRNKGLSALLLFMCIYGLFAYPSDVWSLKVLIFILLGNLSDGKILFDKQKRIRNGLALLLSVVVCVGLVHYIRLGSIVENVVAKDVIGKKLSSVWWHSLKDYPILYERYVQCCILEAPNDTATQQVLKKATCYIPSSSLFCHLGDCYLIQGKVVEAEVCYRQACWMLPGRFLPRYKLFDLYKKQNRYLNACEEAYAILSLPVKVDNTLTLKIRGEAKHFLKSMKGEKV